MIDYILHLNAVTKRFGRRLIFDGIEIEYKNSGVFGIEGPNGSGKSTLVKMIAGMISPNKGKINHITNGKEIDSDDLHNYIGFVSPYLVLYDEFTAEENISLLMKIRGLKFQQEKINTLFNSFQLEDRKKDLLKTYSSGMKQRLKFIFALAHSPKLLLLDEPTSNLDDAGKEAVYSSVQNIAKENIVIIASNEKNDLSFCSQILNLQEFKK